MHIKHPCHVSKSIPFFFALSCSSHAEPVNANVHNSLCKSIRPWKKKARERNRIYLLFFFSFFFFFLLLFSTHCLVNPFVVVVSCTIKPPDVFFSYSFVLILLIQGQLSNNIGACVCLRVVDATSCSSERFFGCRLGRKEIKKKRRERKNEKEKKKIFLLLPVCWHSILVGVWLKRGGGGEEKTEELKKKGLSAQANRPSID